MAIREKTALYWFNCTMEWCKRSTYDDIADRQWGLLLKSLANDGLTTRKNMILKAYTMYIGRRINDVKTREAKESGTSN